MKDWLIGGYLQFWLQIVEVPHISVESSIKTERSAELLDDPERAVSATKLVFEDVVHVTMYLVCRGCNSTLLIVRAVDATCLTLDLVLYA